jgi:putative transcriptional regulator
MKPTHLMPDDVLLSYAAGTSGEAVSLMTACHLTLSPESRGRVQELEAIGGEFFSALPPAELSPGSLESILGRLDEPGPPERPPAPPGDGVYPAPLRRLMGNSPQWRSVWPGVKVLDLPVKFGGQPVRLTQLAPGIEIPRHTHGGQEFNLVLQGGFTDRGDDYVRGDVASADSTVDHHLDIHDDGVCITLVLLDSPLVPLVLKGRIAHWITGI